MQLQHQHFYQYGKFVLAPRSSCFQCLMCWTYLWTLHKKPRLFLIYLLVLSFCLQDKYPSNVREIDDIIFGPQ